MDICGLDEYDAEARGYCRRCPIDRKLRNDGALRQAVQRGIMPWLAHHWQGGSIGAPFVASILTTGVLDALEDAGYRRIAELEAERNGD